MLSETGDGGRPEVFGFFVFEKGGPVPAGGCKERLGHVEQDRVGMFEEDDGLASFTKGGARGIVG